MKTNDYFHRACKTLFLILFVVTAIWVAYQTGFEDGAAQPFTIPSIINIQEAVGTKPDGIVGPHTIRKWEAAYANQEAAKFMTKSGGPK